MSLYIVIVLNSSLTFLFEILLCIIYLVQFGTHDVVVLKPNKADLGSPALGQGVVYRLKVILILAQDVGYLCSYSCF